MGLAIVSGCGFLLRGILRMQNSPGLEHKLSRILPHVIDTLLLASGFTLLLISRQYYGDNPWLWVKFTGILLYIILGVLALRLRGGIWKIFWLLALVVFIWIITIARMKSPFGFLVYFIG